jgi:hypothetical protein
MRSVGDESYGCAVIQNGRASMVGMRGKGGIEIACLRWQAVAADSTKCIEGNTMKAKRESEAGEILSHPWLRCCLESHQGELAADFTALGIKIQRYTYLRHGSYLLLRCAVPSPRR